MSIFKKKRLRLFRKKKLNQWKKEGGRKKSQSFLRHVKTKKFQIIIIAVAALIFILSLIFSSVLKIENIIVTSTNQDINKTIIREFVEPKLLGKNIILFSATELKQSLYRRFEDVSLITISRRPLHTVEVEIKGFPIVAVIKHQGNRYYINKSGVIIEFDDRNLALPFFEFILTPVEEQNVLEAISRPEIETSTPSETELILRNRFLSEEEKKAEEEEEERKEESIVGKKIIDEAELAQILSAIELIEENFNFRVTFAKYIQIAKELHLLTNQNLTIILNAEDDPLGQIKKLKKAQEVINFETLERIDLSIEGKRIYYVEREV